MLAIVSDILVLFAAAFIIMTCIFILFTAIKNVRKKKQAEAQKTKVHDFTKPSKKR